MENSEILIKNLSERGNVANVSELTSYVMKHENEFDISNRFVNLTDEKLSKNVTEKIERIIDILDKNVKFFYYVYVVRNTFRNLQFYVNIHEGLNGHGDFVADDMTNVYSALIKMKNVAKWVSLTDIYADIPDDVSTWCVTFTL